MPYLAMLNYNAHRAEYLTFLNQSLYQRVFVERNRIINDHEFAELMIFTQLMLCIILCITLRTEVITPLHLSYWI